MLLSVTVLGEDNVPESTPEKDKDDGENDMAGTWLVPVPFTAMSFVVLESLSRMATLAVFVPTDEGVNLTSNVQLPVSGAITLPVQELF